MQIVNSMTMNAALTDRSNLAIALEQLRNASEAIKLAIQAICVELPREMKVRPTNGVTNVPCILCGTRCYSKVGLEEVMIGNALVCDYCVEREHPELHQERERRNAEILRALPRCRCPGEYGHLGPEGLPVCNDCGCALPDDEQERVCEALRDDHQTCIGWCSRIGAYIDYGNISFARRKL